MLINDISDPIFLYHAAIGEQPDAETFLHSLDPVMYGTGLGYDHGINYNNVLGKIVDQYSTINNAFDHRDFVKQFQKNLPGFMTAQIPLDKNTPICIWQNLSVGNYSFENDTFPIVYYRYGSIRSGHSSVNLPGNIEHKEGYFYSINYSVDGYDRHYRPSDEDEARVIEAERGKGIMALFVFSSVSESTIEKRDRFRTLTLLPERIEMYSHASVKMIDVGWNSPLAFRAAPPLFVLEYKKEPESQRIANSEEYRDWTYISSPSHRIFTVSTQGDAVLTDGNGQDLSLITARQGRCEDTSLLLRFPSLRKEVPLETQCRQLGKKGTVYSFVPKHRPGYNRFGNVVGLLRKGTQVEVRVIGSATNPDAATLETAFFSLMGSSAALDRLNSAPDPTSFPDWRFGEESIATLSNILTPFRLSAGGLAELADE